MLPLRLRDLLSGSINSPPDTRWAAGAGAAFGGGGGGSNLAGAWLPAAAATEAAGAGAATGERVWIVGLRETGGGAGAASMTEASVLSAWLECLKSRATTSEHASVSLWERSRQGANLPSSASEQRRKADTDRVACTCCARAPPAVAAPRTEPNAECAFSPAACEMEGRGRQ